MLNVTFDAAKDVGNIAKHGVSLAEASEFEWAGALVWPDDRRHYGELRIMALVFVARPPDTPTERRIISLREANRREVNRYAKT